MDNDFLNSRNEKEANMMVNSDKSGIVASINSSVKIQKPKTVIARRIIALQNFLLSQKRLSSEEMNFGRCVQNGRRSNSTSSNYTGYREAAAG